MKLKIIFTTTVATMCCCNANAVTPNLCSQLPANMCDVSGGNQGCLSGSKAYCYARPDGTEAQSVSCDGTCRAGFVVIPNPVHMDWCSTTSGTLPRVCATVVSSWTVASEKYGYTKYEVCDSLNDCYYAYMYKCTKGYYGRNRYTATEMNYASNCTACPAVIDAQTNMPVYGTTASYGAVSVSECFIPSGTVLHDETGTYILHGDCHHDDE